MCIAGDSADRLDQFAEWLFAGGKSISTVAKYIHYLHKVSCQLGREVHELVNGEEVLEQTFREVDKLVSGTQGSLQTYKSAIRAYRDFTVKEVNCSRARAMPLMDPVDNEKKWYAEFSVEKSETLSTLIQFLNLANSTSDHKWVFRGQGFSTWGLETSLGRIAYKDGSFQRIGNKLKQYENDSLWEFYREASKEVEFRDFKDLNLLALMQHYGCKTRLLDFSLSPLVALYMAIDQNEVDTGKVRGYVDARSKFTGDRGSFCVNDIPMSLWAVDLASLNAEGCRWKAFARNSFEKGCGIVRNKGNYNKSGVTVVFPEMCNRRVSAQDGLFLMPNNLDKNFEENLCAGLGMGTRYYAREMMPSIEELRQHLSVGVIKFEIGSQLRDNIKQLLEDANVTAKTVYPDLVGLGMYVGNMIRI